MRTKDPPQKNLHNNNVGVLAFRCDSDDATLNAVKLLPFHRPKILIKSLVWMIIKYFCHCWCLWFGFFLRRFGFTIQWIYIYMLCMDEKWERLRAKVRSRSRSSERNKLLDFNSVSACSHYHANKNNKVFGDWDSDLAGWGRKKNERAMESKTHTERELLLRGAIAIASSSSSLSQMFDGKNERCICFGCAYMFVPPICEQC